MFEINYDKATERLTEEMSGIARFVRIWLAKSVGEFKPADNKGYTARAECKFEYCDNSGIIKATAVLFRPGDATGDRSSYKIEGLEEKWNPRIKTGQAELYFAAGSSVDGKWFSGLTCLEALTAQGQNPSLNGVSIYTELTTPSRTYLSTVCGTHNKPLDRLAFTFDKQGNLGNPHAIGFAPSLATSSRPHEIDYQIGIFIPFLRNSLELKQLRKKLGR
jgi:hypothetical protein